MLTNTKLRGLKARNKIYRIADSDGLAIEIRPTGKKLWRFRYRYNDKPSMLSLGEYPIITLAQARIKRDECKNLLQNNINPSENKREQQREQKQQKEQSRNFQSYFNEWFAVNNNNWSDKYQKEIIKRANKHLLPHLKNISIIEITPKIMLNILKIMDNKGLSETLKKIRGISSQVFRYCVGIGVIEHDPTRDIPSNIFKKNKVKHLAAITDPIKIGTLLRNINNYYGSFQITQALRIAPYIFLRPSELVGLRWNYIDFENKQIKLPADIMKMNTLHIVPLATQVIDILLTSKKINTDSPFVFPSLKSPKLRHITPESLRNALRVMGYSNEEITTHGFRGTASTLLHEQGFNSDYIERQLAHQERNKIKGAYNHAEHLVERRDMMQKWANYLDNLKNV
jgi:integrase